jgi:ATP phosphoribosyltransferase
MDAKQILKLGIPKGSLEEMTLEPFKKSGWKISTSSRSYFPSIDDPTIRCSLATSSTAVARPDGVNL